MPRLTPLLLLAALTAYGDPTLEVGNLWRDIEKLNATQYLCIRDFTECTGAIGLLETKAAKDWQYGACCISLDYCRYLVGTFVATSDGITEQSNFVANTYQAVCGDDAAAEGHSALPRLPPH